MTTTPAIEKPARLQHNDETQYYFSIVNINFRIILEWQKKKVKWPKIDFFAVEVYLMCKIHWNIFSCRELNNNNMEK